MSPYRDKKSGSFIIDRVFVGVGRIKRASGTDKLTTFRAIDRTLTLLFDQGRLDLLRDVRDGTLKPMALYRASQENALDRLPRGPLASPLFPALWAWSKTADVGDYQKASYGVAIRRLETLGSVTTPVVELPALVRRARDVMRGEGHRRGFNILRATAMAFARDTTGRHSPLWTECAAIRVLSVKTKARSFFSYADLHAFARELSPKWAAALWTMALTGMGPRELYGDWQVLPDRIHIAGTKRAGRVRDVPVVDFPVRLGAPLKTQHTFRGFTETFRRALSSVSGNRMTPYDLRRTYARFLELAGITRTHRRMYLGHAAGDVTGGYERSEITAFLHDDAATFSAWLAKQQAALAPTLVREAK